MTCLIFTVKVVYSPNDIKLIKCCDILIKLFNYCTIINKVNVLQRNIELFKHVVRNIRCSKTT